MWKRASLILISCLAAAAAVVAVAARRPAAYRVERSAVVEATPAALLAELADLRRWSEWSPRQLGRPDVQRIFGGPSAGAGSSCYWSNGSSGSKGRITVVGVGPARADFEIEDDAGGFSGDVVVALAPAGAGTRVTWIAAAESGFKGKLLGLLGVRDRRLGAEIERDLAGLKAHAEGLAKVETYRVERSAVVAALPEAILAHLVDLRRWTSWSPWEPAGAPAEAIQRTFGGPATGAGATCYWSGGGEIGKGRMTLLRAGPGSVQLEREVELPRHSLSDNEITLAPADGGTRVSWVVSGEQGRDAESPEVLGRALEFGLGRLRALVEAEGRSATTAGASLAGAEAPPSSRAGMSSAGRASPSGAR